MNKTTKATIFVIVAIGALGAMGIVSSLQQPADAKVICNPSTPSNGCDPPGKSEILNVGQCKGTLQDSGVDKDDSRNACKNFID